MTTKKSAPPTKPTKLRKPQRASKRTTMRLVEINQKCELEIPVPEGFDKNNPVFMRTWRALSRQRPVDDWLDGDRYVLAKICQHEVALTDERALLAKEGTVTDGTMGNLVRNPRTLVISDMERQQLGWVKSLRLLAGGSRPIEQRTAARDEADARKKLEKSAGVSLLA